MKPFELSPLAAEDVASVLALLQAHGLPTYGVADGAVTFFVARSQDGVLGSAGLEDYGASGLLRSVVVRGDCRGEAIATALVSRVLEHAAHARINDVYLLTTAAQAYFERFGFAATARDRVPEAVRNCWEFRTGCPASAVCMHRPVRDPGTARE
jgi:N-acetylglutamate synthase-like GNAT family acetyltransferase